MTDQSVTVSAVQRSPQFLHRPSRKKGSKRKGREEGSDRSERKGEEKTGERKAEKKGGTKGDEVDGEEERVGSEGVDGQHRSQFVRA